MWEGMVAFAQLDSRISHGNPNDLLHASHALDVDFFVTADQAFFGALTEAKHTYSGVAAQLWLWTRSNPSGFEELRQLLKEL